jgi:hypothetical protein
MAPALALEITGLANGAPVEVVGSGEIDAGRLRLEVRTLRANLAFDPALVAVGILDVLAVVGNALGKTDPAHVRSRTDLYDEHGREAGGWRVVAALTRGGGTVRQTELFGSDQLGCSADAPPVRSSPAPAPTPPRQRQVGALCPARTLTILLARGAGHQGQVVYSTASLMKLPVATESRPHHWQLTCWPGVSKKTAGL